MKCQRALEQESFKAYSQRQNRHWIQGEGPLSNQLRLGVAVDRVYSIGASRQWVMGRRIIYRLTRNMAAHKERVSGLICPTMRSSRLVVQDQSLFDALEVQCFEPIFQMKKIESIRIWDYLPRKTPARISAPARCLYLSASKTRGSITSRILSRPSSQKILAERLVP